MKAASSDIAKALLSELKALREKHQQFRSRVDKADATARERDQETRKQNAVLTKRIGELEGELRQARESIDILRQFTELLPTVTSELDAYEGDVEAFEARGSDNSSHDEVTDAMERVGILEKGVGEITTLCNLSERDLSGVETGRDFSLVEGSPKRNDLLYVPNPDVKPNPTQTPKPILAPVNSTTEPIPAANPDGTQMNKSGSSDNNKPVPAASPVVISRQPKAPAAPAPASAPASPQSDIPQTNHERLELILKLMEQPLKLGDLWFIIPQAWYDDWKAICREYPDDTKTEVGQINTSSIAAWYIHAGRMSVSASAWHRLSEWYGTDYGDVPSVVMPLSPEGPLSIDVSPRIFKIYFMLPPSSPRSSIIHGAYTPLVIIPNKCSIRLLRSIILNSLPTQRASLRIELFSLACYDQGWYIPHRSGMAAVLPESEADKEVTMNFGYSVIVSAKVFDATKGYAVPIDPFPSPANPARYLTWSPSCA